jgi:nucleotide-binding universal stress UspA family protein
MLAADGSCEGDAMRVLIAVDASEASRKVLDYVQQHRAMFRDAQLTCVYIDPPPPLRAVGAFGSDPGMPAVTPGEPQAMIEPALAALRASGMQFELTIREGEPGPEIAQIANDGSFDLVVMGAGKSGLLRRRLLGSVSKTVLRQSKVPVLIVR